MGKDECQREDRIMERRVLDSDMEEVRPGRFALREPRYLDDPDRLSSDRRAG